MSKMYETCFYLISSICCTAAAVSGGRGVRKNHERCYERRRSSKGSRCRHRCRRRRRRYDIKKWRKRRRSWCDGTLYRLHPRSRSRSPSRCRWQARPRKQWTAAFALTLNTVFKTSLDHQCYVQLSHLPPLYTRLGTSTSVPVLNSKPCHEIAV